MFFPSSSQAHLIYCRRASLGIILQRNKKYETTKRGLRRLFKEREKFFLSIEHRINVKSIERLIPTRKVCFARDPEMYALEEDESFQFNSNRCEN